MVVSMSGLHAPKSGIPMVIYSGTPGSLFTANSRGKLRPLRNGKLNSESPIFIVLRVQFRFPSAGCVTGR